MTSSGTPARKTGFWLEELAAPYYRFKDAGAEIVPASPKDGRPPLDPKSNEPGFQTDETRRFETDPEATAALSNTVRLDSVAADDVDAVFYPRRPRLPVGPGCRRCRQDPYPRQTYPSAATSSQVWGPSTAMKADDSSPIRRPC
ncbi:hypothetical protein [Streptomyces yatensis]|uniref:DJ-1/PfpI domain-containing protein n=1 Tax=Streptomyces yatensis TaxID=155177 RepID=A0ABN2JL53_9ACTN|nr:hypothetical protein [Streptomyces yatensis]